MVSTLKLFSPERNVSICVYNRFNGNALENGQKSPRSISNAERAAAALSLPPLSRGSTPMKLPVDPAGERSRGVWRSWILLPLQVRCSGGTMGTCQGRAEGNQCTGDGWGGEGDRKPNPYDWPVIGSASSRWRSCYGLVWAAVLYVRPCSFSPRRGGSRAPGSCGPSLPWSGSNRRPCKVMTSRCRATRCPRRGARDAFQITARDFRIRHCDGEERGGKSSTSVRARPAVQPITSGRIDARRPAARLGTAEFFRSTSRPSTRVDGQDHKCWM